MARFSKKNLFKEKFKRVEENSLKNCSSYYEIYVIKKKLISLCSTKHRLFEENFWIKTYHVKKGRLTNL